MTRPGTDFADDGGEIADLLIIGAGINGAGIARDAAGRGLKVVLCEQDDLAGSTSSRSSKLIHGGLRYLEHYEFRLVREALIEREVLLANAPHIIRPMRFVLPHHRELRPAWLVRLGLFLYDHLGGRRRLEGSRSLDLRTAPEGRGLRPEFSKGFVYSDCWVDDARLVVLNALSARELGARVLSRTACVRARREGGLWRAELRDRRSGAAFELCARALVNAAGPWVERVLREVAGWNSTKRVRLVKGSHLVVPKFYEGDHAYLVQNTDRRVIFVNPYEQDFCLIGTTDVAFDGDPAEVAVDEAEVAYLCEAVNRYFKHRLGPEQIVDSFSGVRPLYDDANENPSAVTRDYVFDIDAGAGRAPLLSIFGGKITTYRKLAEHALAKLRPYFAGLGPAWTRGAPLPGGDIPNADVGACLERFRARRPWLPAELAGRYLRTYGTRAERLLEDAGRLEDLGHHFGAGLYERELCYLVEQEWAATAEDILWRRTKLGLRVSALEADGLRSWLAKATARPQDDRTLASGNGRMPFQL